MRFKNVNVSFFNTTHSIPDSLGVCIHTSYGSIVYTGEFKFDRKFAWTLCSRFETHGRNW